MKIDTYYQRQHCNPLSVLFHIMFLALICVDFRFIHALLSCTYLSVSQAFLLKIQYDTIHSMWHSYYCTLYLCWFDDLWHLIITFFIITDDKTKNTLGSADVLFILFITVWLYVTVWFCKRINIRCQLCEFYCFQYNTRQIVFSINSITPTACQLAVHLCVCKQYSDILMHPVMLQCNSLLSLYPSRNVFHWLVEILTCKVHQFMMGNSCLSLHCIRLTRNRWKFSDIPEL